MKFFFRKYVLLSALLALGAGELCFANYQAAQQYFARKDFVRSAGAFFQAYSYPKNKGERAKAEWGLAESLKGSGMLYSASKYYSVIVRRGPSRSNPFFRNALEELGRINSTLRLGQSHIVQLFKTKISSSYIPGPARGFYFYYLGVESYSKRKFEEAERYFRRVPSGSPYASGAQFHLGVIANISGNSGQAISYFERVLSSARRGQDEMRENALLNIARVHYEKRRYRQAIRFYRQIPRDSDNWLQAIWEASWAFFIMQNHNSSLGNIHTIHSPFFENRFYPESYILQAITFLRLCRYKEVKESLKRFRNRYKDVFKELRTVLNKHQNDPKGFFRLVYDYRVGSLSRFRSIWAILDELSRTDNYKEAGDTIRFADRELSRLRKFSSYWRSSGLENELQSFLASKKGAAQADAGRRLYNKGTTYYAYLKDLSDQTGLIQGQMLEGLLERLRRRIDVGDARNSKLQFAGGMEELNVAQRYEYWPFEQEYWEDELGYYVYNINSRCKAAGGKK